MHPVLSRSFCVAIARTCVFVSVFLAFY
jgi:hypothetical protein